MAVLFAGFGLLIVYFIVCAIGALLLRRCIQVPKEVFRKLLHTILLGAVFVWNYLYQTWWIAALTAVLFVVIVYPILLWAERIPGYAELLVERKPGEIKRSLVRVFGMFAVLITVCWGLLDQKELFVTAVLAWGVGDAAAALVGKRFGRHYIAGKRVEGRKSLEGTVAMFVASCITVLLVLRVNEAVVWYSYVPIATITAAICAIVELYSKNGMDTWTCPFAAAAVLIPLVTLWGV